MAIKDQCLQCIHFISGNCNANNDIPKYNKMSCESYKKAGLNLKESKTESNIPNPVSTIDGAIRGKKQRMFSNPFSFEGRITRKEFIISSIISLICIILVPIYFEINSIWIFVLYSLILWFSWAQGTKRCHDIGESGWNQWNRYNFDLFLREGEPYQNEYGPDPTKEVI